MKKSHKVKSKGLKEIIFGNEVIDVSFVEQLVDDSQLRYIAELLRRLSQKKEGFLLKDELERLDSLVRSRGFDAVSGHIAFGLAYARTFEVASSINRMRTLKVRQEVGD